MDLLAGALVVAAAAFLGGVTGFGYSLVATPLLLLLGFPLPFVVTANLGLAILLTQGALDGDALFPAFMLWLPGSLAGNWAGTVIGPRLPETGFRRLTLAIVFLAGAVTALTA